MRRLALAAALALTLSPLTAGGAFAQTAPATASRGLTPAEVATWITGSVSYTHLRAHET